ANLNLSPQSRNPSALRARLLTQEAHYLAAPLPDIDRGAQLPEFFLACRQPAIAFPQDSLARRRVQHDEKASAQKKLVLRTRFFFRERRQTPQQFAFAFCRQRVHIPSLPSLPRCFTFADPTVLHKAPQQRIH